MDEAIRNKLELIRFLGGPEPTETLLISDKVTIQRFSYGTDKVDCLLKIYHKSSDLDDLVDIYQRISGITRTNERCGLAKIYDVTEIGGDTYVIEERVQGHTLRDEIRTRSEAGAEDSGGLFSLQETISIGLQLCDALRVMHVNGLKHLDIKPENIMVQIDGSIRLIDYDISMVDKGLASKSSKMTSYYAAPEQLAGLALTDRTDIYQVSLVMYELLYGWSTESRILTRNERGKAIFPKGNRRMNKILEKCLQPNPAKRCGIKVLSRMLNRMTMEHVGNILFILMAFAGLLIIVRLLTGFLIPADKSGVDVQFEPYYLYPFVIIGSLYAAYRMFKINEPLIAVCIIAFQVAMLLDPLGLQDGPNIFMRDLRTPTQEALRQKMEDASGYDGSSIYEFQYDDFDKDGDYEAFAVIGAVNWDVSAAGERYVGEIWFADERLSYPLSARDTFSSVGYMDQILPCQDRDIVFFNKIGDTGDLVSYIYQVKDGRAMESVLSKKGCVMSWDGKSKGEMRLPDVEEAIASKEIMYSQKVGDLMMDEFYNADYSMPISNGYTSYQIPTFDYRQEAELQRAAAEQGDPLAQLNIGYMYYMGLGVERNYKEAMKWYLLSAEQDFPGAQYSIGVMYEYGIGVEADAEKAIDWYRLAAENGFEEASRSLKKLGAE